MHSILITGITGYLGRNIVKYIKDNNLEYKILGIGHSERHMQIFRKKYPDIKLYKMDISNNEFELLLQDIFENHNINYVIHTAAMKYVNLCEENKILTIKTNILATDILIKTCKRYKIVNMIGISTDKANDPVNTYGFSKNIMQSLLLEANYSVYQGANFFGSDGSVLDIWNEQRKDKLPLTVTDLNCIRYFNDIEYVSELIVNSLDKKGLIIPKYVVHIRLETLLKSFIKLFSLSKDNIKLIGIDKSEKLSERLSSDITDIKEITDDECMYLLKKHYLIIDNVYQRY